MSVKQKRPLNDGKQPPNNKTRQPNTPRNHCIECGCVIPSFHPLFNLVGQGFDKNDQPIGWVCKTCLPNVIDEE